MPFPREFRLAHTPRHSRPTPDRHLSVFRITLVLSPATDLHLPRPYRACRHPSRRTWRPWRMNSCCKRPRRQRPGFGNGARAAGCRAWLPDWMLRVAGGGLRRRMSTRRIICTGVSTLKVIASLSWSKRQRRSGSWKMSCGVMCATWRSSSSWTRCQTLLFLDYLLIILK